MSQGWTTLSPADAKTFLSDRGNKRVGVHEFKSRKRIPWPLCCKCGLLLLKNEATRKAAKAACVVYE